MNDIFFGLLAIVVGVAASYGLYWLLNFIISLLPERIRKKSDWLAFLTPAAVLVILILIAPLIQTIAWSFMDDGGKKWVGFKNFVDLFSDQRFLQILLNNFLWVLVVPAITVAFGTAAAALSNQVGPKLESIFKSLIFMPMAISFVAASTIWSYFYAYVPPGRPEIGLLNAVIKSLGFSTLPLLTIDKGHLNSFLLMAVIVWLQVGYAMVVISSAIKAVPIETIEAAQLDGANPWQVFANIILPQVWGTVMSVFVTTLILVMKIFDIVLAMTRGNFNTSVLAFEWYKQFFENSNIGPASAVITILVLLIAPLMWLQIQTARHQETLR
ncbi:MAG: sugar ABC transporter permease [Chloroflexota bacterium]